MQFSICWSGSSHLHQRRQKSNCSSHIVTQFMDVLFGVILIRTLLGNLLSVIVTHSNDLLMSPIHQLESGNAIDHINMVFRKSAYSLMSRVTASPKVLLLTLSIVMHISILH